jgi:hypothetical protein
MAYGQHHNTAVDDSRYGPRNSKYGPCNQSRQPYEEKHAIRELLPVGLADPLGKIRTAAGMAIATIWWGSLVDDSQYGPRNQSDTQE